MKLYHAPTSPFARKVMACAIARGIDSQIAIVAASGEGAETVAVNPLGKVPCLVTDDGTALFDSRVICEFLDGVGDVIPLFPEHGLRMRALRFQALGDGIVDAAVLRRGDQSRPREAARDAFMAVQRQKIVRSLAMLATDMPANHLDIGSIAVACALGYLDFRFAEDNWQAEHPALASWYDAMLERPCMARTAPG